MDKLFRFLRKNSYDVDDQHCDVEVFIMPANTLASIPSLVPSAMDSDTPIISMANAKLLHSLATCPIAI